ALVLIDLQRLVLSMPVVPHWAAAIYERSMKLAERFRAAGSAVVQVRVSFAADFADAPRQLVDQPSKWQALQPGWDEFPQPPPPSDIIVTKRHWGAFHGTDLDLQL